MLEAVAGFFFQTALSSPHRISCPKRGYAAGYGQHHHPPGRHGHHKVGLNFPPLPPQPPGSLILSILLPLLLLKQAAGEETVRVCFGGDFFQLLFLTRIVPKQPHKKVQNLLYETICLKYDFFRTLFTKAYPCCYCLKWIPPSLMWHFDNAHHWSLIKGGYLCLLFCSREIIPDKDKGMIQKHGEICS